MEEYIQRSDGILGTNSVLIVKENEYSSPIELSSEQVRNLRETLVKYRGLSFKKKNRTKPKIGIFDLKLVANNKYKIRFEDYVGLVKLPKKDPSVLKIVPKFNYDPWNLLNFIFKNNVRVNFDDHIESKSIDDLVFLILQVFVEQMIKFWQNLKKYEYRVEERDLSHVRGRIDTYNTIRNIYRGNPQIRCRYDDFTLDQPYNQVLRYTLSLTKSMLELNPIYREKLSYKVQRLWDDTFMVTNRSFTVSDIDKFEYDHLSLHYFSIHQLAKLIIQNGFASPYKGTFYLSGFLINTWKMFEEFFYSFLRIYLPKSISFTFQETVRLKNNPKKKRIFDFLLKTDDWWAICETKYKIKPDRNDENQMNYYFSNIRAFKDFENIPEKVICVFIYPIENDKLNELKREFIAGDLEVIHAPFMLDKPHIQDERYLRSYLDELIREISK